MALIFNFRGVKIENEEICKAKKQGKSLKEKLFSLLFCCAKNKEAQYEKRKSSINQLLQERGT